MLKGLSIVPIPSVLTLAQLSNLHIDSIFRVEAANSSLFLPGLGVPVRDERRSRKGIRPHRILVRRQTTSLSQLHPRLSLDPLELERTNNRPQIQGRAQRNISIQMEPTITILEYRDLIGTYFIFSCVG